MNLIKIAKTKLFLYALFEDYISNFDFDVIDDTSMNFKFKTRNSGDITHNFLITDVQQSTFDDDLTRLLETVDKKVRELEKRGE